MYYVGHPEQHFENHVQLKGLVVVTLSVRVGCGGVDIDHRIAKQVNWS